MEFDSLKTVNCQMITDNMGIKENIKKMREAAVIAANLGNEKKNAALRAVSEALSANKDRIFAENALDTEDARENGVKSSVVKRLKFDDGKLAAVISGIDTLITLPDPVGAVTLERELAEGLTLRRVTCPIGVIGIIFEARPDALAQISTLCIKSGNCAVLKGGKETARTNRILFDVIKEAAVSAGFPADGLVQASAHSEISELLTCDKDVDLIIPRGSNAFVKYIQENTKIPVLGHADGICHVYIDKSADEEKAVRIVYDAKTQYTAACNACETLLVDRAAAGLLPAIAEKLREGNVKINGTEEVGKVIPLDGTMADDDFRREYLDLEISVKFVDGVEEACRHINFYGSHHTDAIIAEDAAAAEYFMNNVDSAGVYVNASTRFADGFRYGFGAEVGISTSKIHARGPVGLEGLTTYKYKLVGSGDIVADFSEGRRKFRWE